MGETERERERSPWRPNFASAFLSRLALRDFISHKKNADADAACHSIRRPEPNDVNVRFISHTPTTRNHDGLKLNNEQTLKQSSVQISKNISWNICKNLNYRLSFREWALSTESVTFRFRRRIDVDKKRHKR